MCNPIHLDSRQRTGILSSLIHKYGCIRKYIPAGQLVLSVLKSILLMMRECEIHPQRPRDFPRPKRFPETQEKAKPVENLEGLKFAFFVASPELNY